MPCRYSNYRFRASLNSPLIITALTNYPLVQPGDDLFLQIQQGLTDTDIELCDGDVLVLAQKIVSKSEGRYACLDSVTPSSEAEVLAQQTAKDPRLVQLILDESVEVVRKRPGVVIVEHRLGYVHANAGIDRSNIESGDEQVLLLPLDSDASAKALRDRCRQELEVDVKIIINDSAGRAWRNGTCGMAIGTAGFEPIDDLIGNKDLFGRVMEVSTVAVADELAAGASFMMGQGDEANPVVHIRGAKLTTSDTGSKGLIRDREFDLFR
ncbi:MAG: coenzyme F420-0:L-glutamate ligase/coenzyme F420-1:gamma-L-glutamate ligase [Chitinophagales bacterium]|jgi:coenzyme F420-0:L-glutamate ligase/coenzyme F420-1:gamma-L-glutamate ligase